MPCRFSSCHFLASGVLPRRLLRCCCLLRGFQAVGLEPRRLLPGRLLARRLQLFGLPGCLLPDAIEPGTFNSLLTGHFLGARLRCVGIIASG